MNHMVIHMVNVPLAVITMNTIKQDEQRHVGIELSPGTGEV